MMESDGGRRRLVLLFASRVAAGVVGFVGGFIVRRLVSFMAEWRETADLITTTGTHRVLARSSCRPLASTTSSVVHATPAVRPSLGRRRALLQFGHNTINTSAMAV